MGMMDGKLVNLAKQPCVSGAPSPSTSNTRAIAQGTGGTGTTAQAPPINRNLTLGRAHPLDPVPGARNVAPRLSESPEAFAGSLSSSRNHNLRLRQKEGCKLTLVEFAKRYGVDEIVRDKLVNEGFRSMRGLGLARREQLEGIASLKCGEVAELIGAIEEWRDDYRE